jgi:starvation-inducible DNA-binding protein
METLKELLKKLLADTFTMYLKAQNYHWNVEGIRFIELHKFFGDIYEELHSSIDPMAEYIRTLESMVPGSLKKFSELSEVADELGFPNDIEMIKNLQTDNAIIIKTLIVAFRFAEKADKIAIADFLASRIDAHEKHGWMLRSIVQ